MTVGEVRCIMRERAGEIQAWALTCPTFDSIAAELGLCGISIRVRSTTLFGIPVVFVSEGQPEGVIVSG